MKFKSEFLNEIKQRGFIYQSIEIETLDNVMSKNMISGYNFILLDEEIKNFQRERSIFKKVAICLGGSDTYNLSQKIAEWCIKQNYITTVYLGPGVEKNKSLYLNLSNSNLNVKNNVKSLIEEFNLNDFAVTGGGIVAFEASALGLPVFTIANETWEKEHCKFLEKKKCSIIKTNFF